MNKNLVDELRFYCDSQEHSGAILLTGEWGCGKTYFINNEFSKAVEDDLILLKVSLFGLSNVDAIHQELKHEYIEYLTNNNIGNALTILDKFRKFLDEKNFITNKWGKLLSIDIFDFITVKNIIDGKKIVLIFDDLERCQMNSNDILGVINDYCENKNFPTIIIANEEKISEFVNTAADTVDNYNGENKLGYQDIKEKIIQRTICYKPNYETVVKSIIDSFEDSPKYNYKTFLKTCNDDLVQLFSINGLCDIKDKTVEIPHNIRSLKCSLIEFNRVYRILIEYKNHNIKDWLLTFVAYMQLNKANIIKMSERYGVILSIDTVCKTYPMTNENYITKNIINWIENGVWNENEIKLEIKNRVKLTESKLRAKTPVEILRSIQIYDIDQNILEEGFNEYLQLAYEGEFSLDEYIMLLQNCAWAKKNSVKLPLEIHWNKVENGVDKRIDKIKKNLPDGQLSYLAISEKDKFEFSKVEWNIYEKIHEFTNSDNVNAIENKNFFIACMKNDEQKNKFKILRQKVYFCFDEEMQKITFESFKDLNTEEKHMFYNEFISLYKYNFNVRFRSKDLQISVDNLKILKINLENLLRDYPKRTFEVVHVESFIEDLNQIISEIEKDKTDKEVND